MADDAVVVERGVLTAAAEAWDLAVRRAEVVRQLAGRRMVGLEAADAAAEAMAEVEATITLARTHRDTARQVLALLTIGCRTLGRFEEERAYLFGIGIPADFLLRARELGRADLA
jgi:hypothetical protein